MPSILKPTSRERSLLTLVASASFTIFAAAQQSSPPPETQPAKGEEVLVLSPFEVNTSSDVGYMATETLAGSRLNSSLKDVPSQLEVMTPEFIQDLGITSLDDAMRYSLNSMNSAENTPVETQNNAGLRDTVSYGANNSSTRNLGASNTTHDFFDTIVRVDSYNTERFTFASGPNSILFGNSGPSGTIDSSFKRALSNRSRYSADVRVDDKGSLRTVADLNQPLIKNELALRLVHLRDRQKDWQDPAYSNQDRYYGSLVYTPFRKLTIRGYYERAFARQQAKVNTIIQDHVTPWLAAGRPTYNNAAPFISPAASSVFTREITTARPYALLNTSGAAGPIGAQSNTVYPKGYDALGAAPNNFEHSLLDESIYPYDVSPAGNGNGNKWQSWIRGVVAEVNPLPNLFIEAGVNQEDLKQRGAGLMRATEMDLRVDQNLYLNDGVTPNSNLGQYYLQTNTDAAAGVRKNYFGRDQRRLSVSYDLDFTRKQGWSRWLGQHRLGAMYERLIATRTVQQQDLRIVSDNNFIPTANGTAYDNLNIVNRQPIFRYYLTPGAAPWLELPFDPLASGVQTLPGTDSAGNAVKIAGLDSPYGATAAMTGQQNRQTSKTFAMQNRFWDGRIVLTYGRRQDDVDIYEPNTAITTQHVAGANSGFVLMDSILDSAGGAGWKRSGGASPTTSTKGVVVHPFSWLSLSYVEADSQQVSTTLAKNIDGSLAVNGAGEGKDYGITLRLPNHRASLRYVHYETSSIGATSALGATNNFVGSLTVGGTTVGNRLRADLINIERSIKVATDAAGTAFPYDNTYRAYQDDIFANVSAGIAPTTTFVESYAFQSDRVSKGDEITLIANPTKNWRVSLALGKSSSSESNIGTQWFEMIQARIPVWANYLNTPLHVNNAITIRDVLAYEIANFNYIVNAQGKPNPREREYRATLVTRYEFNQGLLRGFSVGGSYLYRSDSVVAYPQVAANNQFPITGVTPLSATIDDQDNPIMGGAITTCDFFTGYTRKLFKGKVQWRVQLNVRNVLGKDEPLLQRALTTGEGAIYVMPEPRTFILSNSFTF